MALCVGSSTQPTLVFSLRAEIQGKTKFIVIFEISVLQMEFFFQVLSQ